MVPSDVLTVRPELPGCAAVCAAPGSRRAAVPAVSGPWRPVPGTCRRRDSLELVRLPDMSGGGVPAVPGTSRGSLRAEGQRVLPTVSRSRVIREPEAHAINMPATCGTPGTRDAGRAKVPPRTLQRVPPGGPPCGCETTADSRQWAWRRFVDQGVDVDGLAGGGSRRARWRPAHRSPGSAEGGAGPGVRQRGPRHSARCPQRTTPEPPFLPPAPLEGGTLRRTPANAERAIYLCESTIRRTPADGGG